MCFLVAALTHLFSREKGATASAIVDALVQLGNGSGASLPGWASGGDRDAVMLGLFNLFDTPSAGPTALDVFSDDDDRCRGEALVFFGVAHRCA